MSSSEVPPAEGSIERARLLASQRSWPELARMLSGVEEGELTRCPELAYLISDACRRIGQLEDAARLAAMAEGGAGRAADRTLSLRVVNLLGMIAYETGDLSEAEARFEALLERASDSNDDEFSARAANNLGVLANIRGDRELALTSYQRALAAYYRLGHARGLAQTHYNVGISYRDLGFAEEADRHYSTAVRYAEEDGSSDVLALAETERGYLRARSGDGVMAESMGLRALERLRAMQDPAGAANAIRMLAEAAFVRGDSALASERLDQALAITREYPDLFLRAELLRDSGRLALSLGRTEEAREAFEAAVAAFSSIGARAEVEATRTLAASC